ncbi:exosortase B [Herbaspirillum sp. NPDC087042]|uniref:exosortase B n=1 Tax=Herbaspirillum sp. NPDC087042 TaxID=3364004 RepID=UPI0037F8B33B
MSIEQTTYPLQQRHAHWMPWLLVALGLAAMYLPSFIDLLRGVWSSERNAHGPIVLLVACCYLGVRVRQLREEGLIERRPAPLAGGLVLLLALACFALGRAQTVLFMEAGSLIPLLVGIVLLVYGVRTCRRLWFAFFFMLFMVPLPASVVDLLTQPLKIGVSHAAEYLLRLMAYPVARSGVVITIGPYQLLVADACAGLNSLFTLEALGLLYMNLVRHPSWLRNSLLALLIVPVSFTANTVRVVVLALITYYLGDAAGQGFLHGFAGMLLFFVALGLIIGLDSLLRWIVVRHAQWRGVAMPRASAVSAPARKPAPIPVREDRLFALHLPLAALVMAGMLVSVATAHALAPHEQTTVKTAPFSTFVPERFGDWRAVPSPYLQIGTALQEGTGRSAEQPYDDELARTYVNRRGEQVMLALAYAHEQMQDVKIHPPEVCYVAQGFTLTDRQPLTLRAADGTAIEGRRFLARNGDRLEPVSYWVRIGDAMPVGGLAARTTIFRQGMQGRIADGILVRASSLVSDRADAGAAYELQQRFLQDLEAALRKSKPGLLVPA